MHRVTVNREFKRHSISLRHTPHHGSTTDRIESRRDTHDDIRNRTDLFTQLVLGILQRTYDDISPRSWTRKKQGIPERRTLGRVWEDIVL
jgi:hypothetical protein